MIKMKEKKISKRKTHGIQLLLRCVVRDPDGKVISDTGTKPAKSFVIAILEFIYGMFNNVNRSTEDTSGASNQVYVWGQWTYDNLSVRAPVSDDDYGLVVGTGDTAEDNEDYKLETQITEGIGAGNITHGAVIAGSAAVVGANVDLELKRAFTNLTGSTITVKEAGIYTESQNQFFCIVRDVLGSPVNVPDNCSLTVYYTVRTTV